jgi:hypothetical protein
MKPDLKAAKAAWMGGEKFAASGPAKTDNQRAMGLTTNFAPKKPAPTI